MWTSIARGFRSGPLTEVEATKSPGLMSEIVLATTARTVNSGARAIDSDWPPRDLTIQVWPPSCSTVPRMRGGAFWAAADSVNAATKRAARNDFERMTDTSLKFRYARGPT